MHYLLFFIGILGLFNAAALWAQLGGSSTEQPVLSAPNAGWELDFGNVAFNEEGRAIIATADGGAVIVGYAQHIERKNLDLWLLKLDADGKKQWEKYLGSPTNSEIGMDIIQLANGGYVVVGEKFNGPYADIWLMRFNANGELLWDKAYGTVKQDNGNSVVQTPDGGFAIAGGKTVTSPEEMMLAYLLKTDSLGNKQWDKEFGADDISPPDHRRIQRGITIPNNKTANDLTMTLTGGYALTGHTNSNTKRQLATDIWTIVTDSMGNLIRSAKAGAVGGDDAFEILQHPDGSLWTAGLVYDKPNSMRYSMGLFCMPTPTNADRDTLFYYNNRNNWYDPAKAAALYQNEYVLVAGETDINRDTYAFESYDEYDIKKIVPWLICVDKTGKMLWDKVWTHKKPTKALSVAVGKKGDIWLTGFSDNATDHKDLWVAKIWQGK